VPKKSNQTLRLRFRYFGTGPVFWSGGPSEFGVQDKDENLTLGAPGPDGAIVFNLSIEVKPEGAGAPVFVGPFAHGPAGDRFLYLSWRNRTGEYAQRFGLRLGGITWDDIHAAWAAGEPLVGDLIDANPKATTTGANIGGRRPVVWRAPAA
jgi:hypothetical protein